MKEKLNQTKKILEHLINGGTITALEAMLEPFGCINLSGRIAELRKEQLPIKDRWLITNSGKRIKQYFFDVGLN